jgi:type II secretory pathway component PulK
VRARLDEVVSVLPSQTTLINANTAPAEVLTALFPTIAPQLLEQFLATRRETPVRGTNELRTRLGLDPRTSARVLQLVSVRSEFFAIAAIATVEPVSQALTVRVRRYAGRVVPISWQTTLPLAERG